MQSYLASINLVHFFILAFICLSLAARWTEQDAQQRRRRVPRLLQVYSVWVGVCACVVCHLEQLKLHVVVVLGCKYSDV